MASSDQPQWGPRPGKGPPSPPGPSGSGPTGPHGPRGPGEPGGPPPRNGLGITALILGIIGLLAGFIPLLFWLAGILGIMALVFGIIGARRAKQGYATNRRMSLAGAILGGLAIVMAIIGIVILADVFHDVTKGPKKTPAPTPTSQSTATTMQGTTTPTSGALRFGTTQHYDDGVQVTVASLRPFTPSDTAAGYTPGDKAVAFDITVTNGSDHNLDLGLVSVDAKDADGRSAERIFDSAKGISGDLSGTLLPGKKSVATYVFDLPKRASASLDVEVRPGFSYEPALWSGSST
ncbi:DUF4352 domain-containing protein [Streptomyces sp. MNU76]|uniref:DUF4190 domain-containing protein n=1 Tax=Streptomyces sp. MNU76 TaxID=2560026 RepID=UPI001E587C81|nr:DUF4190 domain-containing protein [Streptomyces sp. MNU76]MCC9707310.1 DUF4352 domain-containing protein [Streptomyces sp. MNU76]